ncbi:hypothetical protein HN51_050058 [Arachis hypogaea]|uniref:Phytocyanin domain-containing protein n=1 Tax=Arachis hypogaea TaxID=3818 RepID=A0A444YCX6_ARAHY|nr:mavicyanin-like [Arachis ipaensis]XP_025664445.1 mavicyanin-like [Arachis hypogaea]QHN91703.1 Blue copper protein [Arachis hypogaea]RYQ99777.1 hypothetical protein Ahy_B07g087783 [Arachis hypogaea]
MGLSRLSMLVVIATIFLPSIAIATEFIVGDDQGWRPGFDYNSWAASKVFHVGDTLEFKYGVGEHNVYKVDGSSFQSCTVPTNSTPMTSGDDHILLATEGKKWYICGVAGHCSAGQKLVITVLPNLSPAPAPAGPSLSAPSAPAPVGFVPAPAPIEQGPWSTKNKNKRAFKRFFQHY